MPEHVTHTERIDVNALWRAVLAELQITLSEYVFNTWMANTQATTLDGFSLEISCPSEYSKKILEKNCISLIQQSVNKIGKGDYTLSFIVGKAADKSDRKIALDKPAPLFEPTPTPETKSSSFSASGVSPRFTFDNYIRGNNNQLAYSIAWAVATNPGTTYNPVFFYSGVGLGKTHLIQAIGNKIIREKPNLKVVYTTGESFTNELIESIQSGRRGKGGFTPDKFRKKYRDADVLLVDDIQFIVGREATQEEFFHTFNALHMAQKQIVITSDRPPRDFTNLEERVKSRFGSGITADMQPPDWDTRVAILRSKRDRDKDNMANEVIDYIAQKVNTNIRELEGAYLQVLTYIKATGSPNNLDTAVQALGQTIREDNLKPVNLNQVLNAVCNYYSVTGKDIKGKRRTRELVIPRQVAMYLIRVLTETPYMTIGEFLGGRDHTTVLYGIQKVEEEIKVGAKTRQDVANVKQIIYQS
ncbi:MAG: chromosomal replication initiator protein DnaA [Patescibacteria group bacterium]|jgi:chromosomal replication initiator protein